MHLKSSLNNDLRWKKTIHFVTALVALLWTAGIFISLLWNVSELERTLQQSALIMGRTAFEKDVLYRRWNSGHGGVYVPVTDITKPNPYLNDYPGQIIETKNGMSYTLINPAYMTRQVFELQVEETGIIGHITSLNPIRPENGADAWETTALKAFETGEREYYSIEMVNGAEYLRYMSPLVVEERCLKCHEQQGYKVGDVRGGISEAVPMQPLVDAGRQSRQMLILGHIGIWLFGLAGIFIAGRRTGIVARQQADAEKKLLELSTRDGLTGLYNRSYFEEFVAHIEALKNQPVSVISADVDGLKVINDTQGHAAGDRHLRNTAGILQSSLRETDVLSRTGGDEFIVILPNTGEDQARNILERIRTRVETWNQNHGEENPVRISFGLSTSSEVETLESVMRLADQRMYQEKASRR